MEQAKKDWNEIKSNDSWAVFKIMSEFVEGYDRMSKIGPCVSIFGSARTKEDNKYYQLTVEIAQKIAQLGYGVISGGGPGIMEAANKEAGQAGFYKIVKCKLSTAAVGSKNKRMTFTSMGLADDTEADVVMKEFLEFKEGVANENASKLVHFAKEQISWTNTENVEYIAAYLENPMLATYNDTRGISKMLLPKGNAVVNLNLLGQPRTGQGTTTSSIAEAFESGDVEEDATIKSVSTDAPQVIIDTGVTKEAVTVAPIVNTMEAEKARQKAMLAEVNAAFGAPQND
jgi:hypothetical protein